MKAAIEGRVSAVITGDSGCGKTCLLRVLEEDLPQGRYRLLPGNVGHLSCLEAPQAFLEAIESLLEAR